MVSNTKESTCIGTSHSSSEAALLDEPNHADRLFSLAALRLSKTPTRTGMRADL
jgi:hypothetical protein